MNCFIPEAPTIIPKMQMKKKHFLLGIIAIVSVSLFFIDRNVWMKRRATRHWLWENCGGEPIRGDFIMTEYLVKFENNTMYFDFGSGHRDTLTMKWQYFSAMKVMDPKTGKTGIYCMKGANWVDIY